MPEYPIPDMAEVELLGVLKAVADPIRLEMVRVLADGRPHPKGEDSWHFDCTKSTLAHHFRALREAGLTIYLVDGRTHSIQLRRDELDEKFPGLIDAIAGDERPA